MCRTNGLKNIYESELNRKSKYYAVFDALLRHFRYAEAAACQEVGAVGSQEMGKFTFHVRKLPDPTAYLDCKDENGNPARYRGEKPISKAQLLATQGIGAAIDDGLLDIAFKVTAFETTFFDRMGNVIPEVSKSDKFTERQKEMFRELGRGKRFYISNVKAIGPDGVERTLSGAIPVIIR